MDKCVGQWKDALRRFKEHTFESAGVLKGKAKETGEKVSLEINRVSGQARNKFDEFWEEHLSRWNKKVVLSAGAGVLSVLVAGGALIAMSGTDVYKVTADGEILGYVQEETVVAEAVSMVKTDLAEKAGVKEILVEEDQLAVEATDLRKKDVSFADAEELSEKLAKTDLCMANGWALMVGDDRLVVTTTKKNAEKILEDVKATYLTEGSEVISAQIKEDVAITKSAVRLGDLKTVEDAVSYIATGKEEPVTYTVGKGESLWVIASNYSMSPYELMALNPDVTDPASLKVGQQIRMTAFVPYLTVTTQEKITTKEAVPYETVYEKSSSLNAGVTRVKTEGVEGVKETVAEVVKENGKVVSNTVLTSSVVQEPQKEVALQGTKGSSGGSAYVASIASASYGSGGSLTRPVPVNVSSSFGASRGGRRHTGVDLRNPAGTPIVAAAAGTVTVADYRGTCGLMVKIDHGNGMETWYEHCNTVSVTPGQTVSEVRINGVPQNPLNYL